LIFYDTETCGLHGMCVLIQWAKDDGPINLHDVWKSPIYETLRLIEEIINDEVVGFNLAFDHFHLCKLYTILSLYQDQTAYPEDIIEELAELEPQGRDGPCLRVKAACDLMLHARKGKYQSTMERRPIMVRKVPTVLAYDLAKVLDERLKFSDTLFARQKVRKAERWSVRDIEGKTDLKNLVLDFRPSAALKVLALDALNEEEDSILKFRDIEPAKEFRPEEEGYAPFAKAIGESGQWNGAWPEVIKYHIDHWAHNKLARKYAMKDVEYTRKLYHFFGAPKPGDDDSELACMVGASRWRGYKVDLDKIRTLKAQAEGKLRPWSSTPKIVKRYIASVMSEVERAVFLGKGTTKKVVLEELSTQLIDCEACGGDGCGSCEKGVKRSEVAIRAQEVLDARKAGKEIELYNKLLLAGRFHASFKIIGALSSRMSGADGLNPQGIKKTKNVRSAFPLAWDDMILTGGDFSGFEVTIADAVYNDPRLRKDLLTCEKCEGAMELQKREGQDDFVCTKCGSTKGKKIHALFGMNVYPGMSYYDILATDGTIDDKYTRCKSAVFAMLYGGTGFTLKDRLNVDIDVAEKAVELFHRQYREVGTETKRVTAMFTSLSQPNGLGSKVEYRVPQDFVESMYGFRRYFTLENSIIKALYELGEKPPKAWTQLKIKITRREDRPDQFVGGAVRSALFGAAFGIMSGIIRAAKNHKIQSAGASITKMLQRRIWDLQPIGVNDWMVQPMNIHDEIQNPCKAIIAPEVKKVVDQFVDENRLKVPLLKVEWKSDLKTWADKS
jgi:hypothetical protein